MAFVVPVVTAIGGGSAAVGATLLATTALTVGSGVMSARASRAAGKAEQARAEMQAKAEGDAARQREIERKRHLLRALSSQQARAAALGLEFSGSIAGVAERDIQDATNDLLLDRANTRSRQRALRFGGEMARFQGRTQARASLLDTAASVGPSLAQMGQDARSGFREYRQNR